jgi:hypothetical protein
MTKDELKKRADEYATSCFPYEKQFLEREAVVKCCVHVVTETIADLEKENAELKSIADFQTSSNMDRYFQLKRRKEQLTKAKEIIENLIGLLPDEVLCHDYYKRVYVDPAEQFLKEIK